MCSQYYFMSANMLFAIPEFWQCPKYLMQLTYALGGANILMLLCIDDFEFLGVTYLRSAYSTLHIS